jgi:hypothetical protein
MSQQASYLAQLSVGTPAQFEVGANTSDRQVAAARGAGLLQLPRRTWQRPTPECLPKGCGSGLDVCPATAWSALSDAVGPVPATRLALPSHRSGTSSVPERAPSRHDLRQEPYAVVPHVRICAGGGEQSPSLPRPTPPPNAEKARVLIAVHTDHSCLCAGDASRSALLSPRQCHD